VVADSFFCKESKRIVKKILTQDMGYAWY
jgi:hypothetical protein